MSCHVNRSWNDVQIVEIEQNATGHEAIDAIGNNLAADIKDFDVPQIILQTKRFIRLFIVLNALAEI
jgi:hypothetical protein